MDGTFDVTQFNRVAAQQLASNRRTFPTSFANLRADSVKQVGFSVIKSFSITEKLEATYRCELFNSTNRITGQANTPRRIQMALRLVF